MKSTIKLDGGKSVVVLPGASGTVRVDLAIMGVGVGGMNLQPNECGALMFAIEQAAEAAGIELDRQRASEGTQSARRIVGGAS